MSAPEAEYEARENARTLGWLDQSHLIGPEVERRLRAEIGSWPTPPSVLVPTHGDWQPRNWVVNRDVVRVIDFGRADLRRRRPISPVWPYWTFGATRGWRPPSSRDTAPTPANQQRGTAFCVREAIGTAVWAHLVGDTAFEAHGHRMIAAALDHGEATSGSTEMPALTSPF